MGYDPRKISGMPVAHTVTGEEYIELLQGGQNKQVQVKKLKALNDDERYYTKSQSDTRFLAKGTIDLGTLD